MPSLTHSLTVISHCTPHRGPAFAGAGVYGSIKVVGYTLPYITSTYVATVPGVCVPGVCNHWHAYPTLLHTHLLATHLLTTHLLTTHLLTYTPLHLCTKPPFPFPPPPPYPISPLNPPQHKHSGSHSPVSQPYHWHCVTHCGCIHSQCAGGGPKGATVCVHSWLPQVVQVTWGECE